MTHAGQNKELFDALLKISISEAMKQELEAIPASNELNKMFIPSHELDKRIKRIIIQGKAKLQIRHYAKKAGKLAACIIILLILSPVTLPGVKAARNVVFHTFFEWFGKYTQIEFRDQEPENEENIYKPSYLPSGFKEESTQTYGNAIMQIYTNETGDKIIFEQQPADTGNILIDNENTEYSEVKVAGDMAYLFQAQAERERNMLLWQSEGIIFELTSQISSDELIQIGNSLKK